MLICMQLHNKAIRALRDDFRNCKQNIQNCSYNYSLSSEVFPREKDERHQYYSYLMFYFDFFLDCQGNHFILNQELLQVLVKVL